MTPTRAAVPQPAFHGPRDCVRIDPAVAAAPCLAKRISPRSLGKGVVSGGPARPWAATDHTFSFLGLTPLGAAPQ